MKYILITIMATMCSYSYAQQDTAKANATMNDATVYFGYGAELTHKAKINVTKNTRFIVIDKLSTQLDQNSLQISCPENISLLSQQFSLYYPTLKPKVESSVIKRYRDTIKTIKKNIAALQNKQTIEQIVLQKTEEMIQSTITTSANKTTLTAEVLKLIDYYNAKVEKNKKNIFDIQQQINDWNENIEAINERINIAYNAQTTEEEKIQPKPYGRIIMQVVCRTEQEAPISLSYYTNNAGWQPLYDLRVNSSTNNIKLVYKASVTQNTGIDWKQAKLTLSTGTPSFTTVAPLFNVWYLQYYVPQLYKSLEGRAQGLSNSNLKLNDKDFKRNDIQNFGNEYAIDDVKTVSPSTLEEYTNLKQGLLNTNFEIDLPYDIESNGLAHSINIKEENLQSNLKNYAAPKLDADAYLLAELTNWQNLDLIPGNANIIMDDTYIGKSFIDPNTTADTLNLSLGKDKRVAVKRVLVKDASSTKTRDDFTKQTFTYELTVKNNKQKELKMLLKDQFPLSNVKEVVVTLDNDGEAIVNEEIGVLTWKINLKPGEVKKVRFSYTVKYPKDKKIANLK